MKIIIKYIIAQFNKLWVFANYCDVSIFKNSFFLVRLIIKKSNILFLKNTKIEKSDISILGSLNELNVKNSIISHSNINIKGNNNKLIIEKDVKLRKVTVNIRGDNCKIIIGKGSSFGGARIVNVGFNNNISIGENCLFADNIEVWASDTHSIFNENKEMINSEKSIHIMNNVWIGSHVIILKGVTIENNSVIGMGSIVTNNVKKNAISVGTPNRIIRENITWDLDYKNID